MTVSRREREIPDSQQELPLHIVLPHSGDVLVGRCQLLFIHAQLVAIGSHRFSR